MLFEVRCKKTKELKCVFEMHGDVHGVTVLLPFTNNHGFPDFVVIEKGLAKNTKTNETYPVFFIDGKEFINLKKYFSHLQHFSFNK